MTDPTETRSGDRPNILFIQVDQLLAQSLRFYGDPVCLSPHLDRLAGEGVVFETAYSNFPLCAPSRFSMASGLLPSRIGAYDNASEFPSAVPTYAHYLRDLGYQTSLSGKMHFVGADQTHGFEERLTPDIYPADFSWSADWGDASRQDANDDRALTIAGPCANTVQIDYDLEVTHRALRKLYAIAGSDDERPFFLQVSMTHPHDPYLCLKEHWDRYDGLEIPAPLVPHLSDEDHDPLSQRLLDLVGMRGRDYPPELAIRARRGYYGSISFVDDRVGELLRALEQTGLADNTVIVFTSDHGDMFGERGMWFKRTFFEQSVRVPFMVHAPGRLAPGRVASHVSLVDLVPTIMSLATQGTWSSPTEALDGTDATAFIGQPAADRAIVSEYFSEAADGPMIMIRRGAHKYIYGAADPEQLYDLEQDPRELTNLAPDPAQADRLAAFRADKAGLWDEDWLTRDIVRSQKRRRFVHAVLKKGRPVGGADKWDFGEDAGWFRGETGYNDWAFAHLPARD